MRPWRIPLVVLVVLLGASPAAAQKKSIRDELPPAALTAWDNARQLYDAQDWTGARAEFQHAFELSQNPRVLFNVGVCEKNLLHYSKASKAFRTELSLGGDKLAPADVAAIKSALATLEPLISTIVVTVSEPDAELTVDGEPVGKSPFLQAIAIDVGVHALKLTKPGFLDATLPNVTVVSNETTRVTMQLDPVERKAPVTIDVVGPRAAAIFVDGRDVGNAPFRGELTAGPHVLEARADEFATARQQVTVVYRQKLALVLTLSPKRHQGVLRLVAAPEGATIEIDGKRVGETRWEGPVTSREGHVVTVKRSGFYSFSQEVILDDDQERSLPVTLNPEKTWIWWTLGAVAVVGAGVAIGYFVFRQPTPDPVPGTLDAGNRGWGTTSFRFP